MTKHKHAELMAEYAKDAMETDKPWEIWQLYHRSLGWVDVDFPLTFIPDTDYRRKPKTSRERFDKWAIGRVFPWRPAHDVREGYEWAWEVWQEAERQAKEVSDVPKKQRKIDMSESKSMGDVYRTQTDRIAELEAELDRYRNGFQGSCYACETVGEKNVELEAEVGKLREALLRLWAHVCFLEYPIAKEVTRIVRKALQ